MDNIQLTLKFYNDQYKRMTDLVDYWKDKHDLAVTEKLMAETRLKELQEKYDRRLIVIRELKNRLYDK